MGVNEFTLTSILGAFTGDYDDIEKGRKIHDLSIKIVSSLNKPSMKQSIPMVCRLNRVT